MPIIRRGKNCMTGSFFVDTDLFVCCRDARDPNKQARARRWLEFLWTERLGRTSMQVLNEYYRVLTRKLKPALAPDQARASAGNLFAWNPRGVDQQLIERAWAMEDRHRLSSWDSLIVAAAQLQTCSVLLSEHLQDGCVYDTVTVLNPFKIGLDEARAICTAAPTSMVRRRGRGRPKKVA